MELHTEHKHNITSSFFLCFLGVNVPKHTGSNDTNQLRTMNKADQLIMVVGQ